MAWSAGTISPAAKVEIWNLLSVASATYLENVSDAPHKVSSDFGKLEVSLHLISGEDCAMAGAATAEAASPTPAVLMNSRRFMTPPSVVSGRLFPALSWAGRPTGPRPPPRAAFRHTSWRGVWPIPAGGQT